MKSLLPQTLLLAVFLSAGSASAQMVTNTFSGQVTKLRVGPDSLGHAANNSDGPAIGGEFAGLGTGDSFSLSFVFDPVAAPILVDPSGSYQYALLSWSVTAGGYSISGAGGYDQIIVNNDFDKFGDGQFLDLFAVVIQSGYWADVEFQDRSLTALNSTAIPNTFTPGNWDQQIFDFDSDGSFELPGSILAGSEDNSESVYAYFRVNDFYSSVPVPEPCIAALLGTGLAGFLLVKHRRFSGRSK